MLVFIQTAKHFVTINGHELMQILIIKLIAFTNMRNTLGIIKFTYSLFKCTSYFIAAYNFKQILEYNNIRTSKDALSYSHN